MGRLTARKTKLTFETADDVWERGRRRVVLVEAHPAYAVMRLKGDRRKRSFPITYEAIYRAAVKIHVAAERQEKSKKPRRKTK